MKKEKKEPTVLGLGLGLVVALVCAGAGVVITPCECVHADGCGVCRGGSRACNGS